MKFTFSPITEADAAKIAAWNYSPPYDCYNLSGGETELIHKHSNYHVCLRDERIFGFLCWGGDARVPGFDYEKHENRVDVGWGMAPESVGSGLGKSFIKDTLEFISAKTASNYFQVTVAAFNARCLKACNSVGFEEYTQFKRPADCREFIVLRMEWPSKNI